MKLIRGFVLRKMGERTVAVYVGTEKNGFRGMITLNDTAAFLWNLLNEGTDEGAMVKALIAAYDVKEEEAARDVAAIVDKLRTNHLLEAE